MSLSAPLIKQEIQRCAQLDSAGLDALVQDYGPQLIAYANCVLTPHQSQQVVEDFYYLIWQHAKEYSEDLGDSVGWLLSIFRHLLRQQLLQNNQIAASHEEQQTLLDALIQKIRAKPTEQPLQHAINSCDDATLQLLLGRYFFAWDESQCRTYTGLDEQQIQKKLEALYSYLTLYFQPWAVQDVAWQKLNAQACVDALCPSPTFEAVDTRRHEEVSAAQDTLRWEALFAELCTLLPTAPLTTEFITALEKRLQLRFSHHVPPRAPAAPEETTAPDTPAQQHPAPPPVVEEKQVVKHKPKEIAQLHRSLLRWKLFNALSLLIIIALTVWLLRPTEPPITIVQMAPRLGAVLQAPGLSASPGWVLSVDPQGQVLLTPLVDTELTEEQRAQLWTRVPETGELRSLGLINPNAPVTLTTETIGEVRAGQLFEITLESSAQQSENEPLGPVLFIGRVVSLGAYED